MIYVVFYLLLQLEDLIVQPEVVELKLFIYKESDCVFDF